MSDTELEDIQTLERRERINPTHEIPAQVRASQKFIQAGAVEDRAVGWRVEAGIRDAMENADVTVEAGSDRKPGVVMSLDSTAASGVRFDVVDDAVPVEQNSVTISEHGDILIPVGMVRDEEKMERYREKEATLILGDQTHNATEALAAAKDWGTQDPDGYQREIEVPARQRAANAQMARMKDTWTKDAIGQMRDVSKSVISDHFQGKRPEVSTKITLGKPTENSKPKTMAESKAQTPGLDV